MRRLRLWFGLLAGVAVAASAGACGGTSDAGIGEGDAAAGGDGSSSSNGGDDGAVTTGDGSNASDGNGGDSGGDGAQGNGDAGRGDAGRDAAGFACGSLTCKPNEYCESVSGGPQIGDGGAGGTFSCQPAPPGCNGTPTCSCVAAVGPCRCTDTNGEVRVDCPGV